VQEAVAVEGLGRCYPGSAAVKGTSKAA
jgi:hypothetical protein